ncbi:MAG: TonB-dependent receptor [Chitinophagaceae bacterium]
MKHFKLFLILVALSVAAHSQSIKGKLADPADNKSLAGATLTLTAVKDSTSFRNSISDSAGSFKFEGLSKDSFFLKVSSIGYDEFRQIVAISDSIPDLDLHTLYVPKTTVQLGGVTVTSKTPPVQQKGDTTQFNASQFKVNPDATVEDLIKKMPGITVARDGTVTTQGEQVKKVTIDGRDFFGDDASAALKNLPSDIVDKIQVFDRLSDQAQITGVDDGNSQKAINIVTKSGMKNGQFGRVFAGYGTDDRYSLGGNMSFFKNNRRISVVGLLNNINQQNFGTQDLLGATSSGGGGRGGGQRGGGGRGGGGFGGGQDNFLVGQQTGISKTNALGINYSDKWGKKVDVSGSYFFNNSDNNNDQVLNRQNLGQDTIKFYDENSVSQSQNFNHRINMRLEYKIDSSNSLIISPSLNFQKTNSTNGYTAISSYNEGDLANESKNTTTNSRSGYNLRNNILYRHNFAKRGRTLSFNFNTTFNNNEGESFVLSETKFYKGGVQTDSTQNQFTDNLTKGYNLSSNLTYTEPVGKKGQLQFSYAPSYSKNKADQQTFQYDAGDGKYSEFDITQSNKFENIVKTQNGGITYRLGNSRDNQFAVGVNFQQSKLESERVFPTSTFVNKTFSNVLPNLQWSKKISPKSSFRLFYRASTNAPSVNQLQDVVNSSNVLLLSSGNPELKQQTSHFLSGRYTFTNTQKGQSLFANIFLQASQNYITSATFRASKDSVIQQGIALKQGSQLTKPINLDGYKSLRSFLTYSMPVKFLKSNINLNTGFSYSKLPGQVNYTNSMTDNYTYSTGVGLSSNINEYIDFNLSYSANFNTAKNTVQSESNTKYVNQAAGAQINLLSKSGWFLQNDVSNQSYTGLSAGFNQSFWLWNAAIGKKFLKSRAAELKLSVFDLLKQNQSISREITANYIQDTQSQVLQQYFMLTFTYSLKNFGKAKPSMNRERRAGRPDGFFP